MGLLTSRDVNDDVHLLRGRARHAFGSDPRAIVAALLHELANIFKGAVQLLLGIKLSQLQLRCIHDLISCRTGRSAFHIDRTYKKVRGGREGEYHSRARRLDLRLNICEAPGRIQCANTVADVATVERFSRLLWQGLHNVGAIDLRHAGYLDGLNGFSLIPIQPRVGLGLWRTRLRGTLDGGLGSAGSRRLRRSP